MKRIIFIFSKTRSFLRRSLFGHSFWLGLLAACFASSCGGGNEEEQVDKTIQNMMDSVNIALGVSGRVFIIPSPIQTAILIQKSGAAYNKGMLNETGKANSYSTQFHKCLNLGIYGADLGYTTLYDQTQDAIVYFKVAHTLANDIGLASAFDKQLMDRFQKNLGNKDSMLVLVSAAYRASNDFLKHNDRNEEAALIIAGGWIETLHFAVNVMRTKSNEDVKRRIADQKNTLSNLISLLSTYQGNEEYGELLQKLNDLKAEFEKVQYKYVFKQPVTNEVGKVTTITSESEITIAPETILLIEEKIVSIRNLIVA